MQSPTYRLGRNRGVWCAVHGRGRNKARISLGIEDTARNRPDALREVAKLNSGLIEARRKGDTTVAAIFEAYAKDREADGIAAAPRIRQAWKALGPHWGHLTPDLITKATSRAYVKLRRDHGVSNGGIKTEMDYLSTALKFGKAEKLYTGDKPEIHRPPAGRPRERWLTREEAAKLIAGARAFHIKLWLHLSLATAGRPSHILQLEWARVDLRQWTHPESGVTYYGSVDLDDPTRDATKKGRAKVPLNKEAAEALRVAREMATSKYVIEAPDPNGLRGGAPIKRVTRGVSEAARRARLTGITPYVLRHTAGVWMAQAGLPMAEISQYMGHSSTAVTERVYARFHPDYLRRAADALRINGDARAIEDKREDRP
jgi:integrase